MAQEVTSALRCPRMCSFGFPAATAAGVMSFHSTDRVRVSCGRVVIPPFGCGWLSDANSKLSEEGGCIVFEVSGETDATIILKSKPGSRRLQSHTERDGVEDNHYVVIFGSHRNSVLSIERNGQKQANVCAPWTRISPDCFRKFWICYVPGTMHFGTGTPSGDYEFKWEDPSGPLHGIHFVGLSAWDKHCTFRNVCVLSSMPWLMPSRHVPSLFDLSASTLSENLNLTRACAVMMMVDCMEVPNLIELHKQAVEILTREFESLVQDYRPVFCNLSSQTICSLLKSPELSVDETFVFDAVVLWMFGGETETEMKREIRSPGDVQEVLKWIRFATIEKEELHRMLSRAFSMGCVDLCEAIQDALRLQSSISDKDPKILASEAVGRASDVSSSKCEMEKFWRRSVCSGVHLQYLFDHDGNGVFSYLGRNCRTMPWKNPMLCNKVMVKASSPTGRFTSPKAVVSNRFSITNFAGPKRTENELLTWWMVDLLDFSLLCNYYTIRHDASTDYVRFWDFQGSNDGRAWVVLRRHENDCRINAPGGCGSWPIYCNTKPYKMFRLLLTRPTDSQVAPRNLALSNLELYGILTGPGIG